MGWLGLGLALGFCLAGIATLCAATTGRIVADRHTGLAINGFDPVAYFTEGTPTIGQENTEFTSGGVTWRFRNIGNREAFVERPDVYMPRFGGYDPLGIARAVAVPGNPVVWVIFGQRLYLFYNRDNLAAFSADPNELIVAAERRWPEVLRQLAP